MHWLPAIAAAALAIVPANAGAAAADRIAPPPSGQGQIVVFRRAMLFGGAVPCAVHEGAAVLADLAPGRFAVVNLLPGIHALTIPNDAGAALPVEVAAGHRYFSTCAVAVGWFGGHATLVAATADNFAALGPKLRAAPGMAWAVVAPPREPAAPPGIEVAQAAASASPVAAPRAVAVASPSSLPPGPSLAAARADSLPATPRPAPAVVPAAKLLPLNRDYVPPPAVILIHALPPDG